MIDLAAVDVPELRAAIRIAFRECWDVIAYRVTIAGEPGPAIMVRIRDYRRIGIAHTGDQVEWFGTLAPNAIDRKMDAWLNGTEELHTERPPNASP
ncbi:MAG: hypothetical protein H7338_15440 [Candidatus Sericytochromatia bacterium]|nr:hypothetical protein [Candidatus Sericytochromatia bacterium]